MTKQQINELCEKFGLTKTGLLILAIDWLDQAEVGGGYRVREGEKYEG